MTKKAILVTGASSGVGRGAIRAPAQPLGDRDLDYCARCLHVGTNHFTHSGKPADEAAISEYDKGPYAGFGEQVRKAFAAIVPPDADASAVADAMVQVVNTPFGKRPFRVHPDPTEDGASVGFTVLDRVRAEMLHRVGLSDLLKLIVRV